MQEKHFKYISLGLPIIFLLLFSLSYFSKDFPEVKDSTYVKALEMNKTIPTSHTLLASQIQNQQSEKLSVTEIEIFNEKFSLPLNQLAINLEALEKEHKEIIYKSFQENNKLDRVTSLTPRLRITIALSLSKNPADLNLQDLQSISSNQLKDLEKIALMKDFKSSLSSGQLAQDLLNKKNPQRKISTVTP